MYGHGDMKTVLDAATDAEVLLFDLPLTKR